MSALAESTKQSAIDLLERALSELRNDDLSTAITTVSVAFERIVRASERYDSERLLDIALGRNTSVPSYATKPESEVYNADD